MSEKRILHRLRLRAPRRAGALLGRSCTTGCAGTEEDLAWLREHGFNGPEDDPSVAIDPPDDRLPTIWFNHVPEPKSVKNRVDIDVNLESAEEADRALGLGAKVVRPFGAVEGGDWEILADPEGNEFCVFPPRQG